MKYYSHHIGDFNAGTVRLTQLERWIYRDMIEVYYDIEGPLPLDIDAICKKVGARAPEHKAIVEELLKDKFVQTTDGYRHDRCDDEISVYRLKQDQARENGKKGGRPRKADQNPQKPIRFQPASQSDAEGEPLASDSKTNQEPRTKNQEPKKPKNIDASRFDAQAHLESLGVDPKVARDWIAMRNKKRAAPTETAIDGIAAEALKAGVSLEQALRTGCERGWQGFNAEWLSGANARASPSAGKGKANRHGGFDEIDYREGVNADGSF